MSHIIPELDAISDQLVGKSRKVKPKILVVDDEPDNLDLLYRTFRRDFQVLKASSGMDALSVLTSEGEVAVIISDQRMPEMKGTEFLSKTVPQFPNTIRIILTGFTDVEDLVEAINSGQVYKYITKPWDPGELKDVVKRATETYALLRQRTHELGRAQQQATLLKALVDIPRACSTLEECLSMVAQTFGNSFQASHCTLQMVTDGALTTSQGVFSSSTEDFIVETDPLIKGAIATQKIQLFLHTSPSDHTDYYADTNVGTQLVIPLMYKDSTSAMLALRWDKDFTVEQEDVSTLHLVSHQLALSLACMS
ncbi:MAG: response regulator [Moorea sp. SIO3C2]|nr:response regulator [Moorena sp. SIO3C2]